MNAADRLTQETITAVACRAIAHFASLGPVPPRTPGRPDAQVPRDLADGPVRYARIAHFYFYDERAESTPAFGFHDIEISLQKFADGSCSVELYCICDGYQSGAGSHQGTPLRISFAAGDDVLATSEWFYPTVGNGRTDPMTFRTPIDLTSADFDRVDRVILPPVSATCRIDLD